MPAIENTSYCSLKLSQLKFMKDFGPLELEMSEVLVLSNAGAEFCLMVFHDIVIISKNERQSSKISSPTKLVLR